MLKIEEKIYFTLITNKYLAHAKVLIDSFSKYNKGKFVVGLIDKIDSDVSIYENLDIVPVENIEILEFGEMKKIYNVIELLTACKPFYFRYLMSQYPNSHSFIYLDSDICFYNSIDEILNCNRDYSILLTPHFLSPQPDDLTPSDHSMLTTGIFNMGFLCINRFKESIEFNEWWCNKLVKYCFADIKNGYFTDQLWVNFAPSFISNCKILRNLGLNVSNWNLHERKIDFINGEYLINRSDKLLFYHFSNFNIEEPEVLAWYNNRYNFSNRPEMKKIFDKYVVEVKNNGYEKFKLIPWAFQNEKLGKWYIIFKKIKKRLLRFNEK